MVVRHVCVDHLIILILIIICMYSNAPLLPFIMGLVSYNYSSRYPPMLCGELSYKTQMRLLVLTYIYICIVFVFTTPIISLM